MLRLIHRNGRNKMKYNMFLLQLKDYLRELPEGEEREKVLRFIKREEEK